MIKNVYIGIDNGVSGSIGIIYDDYASYERVPTFKQRHYSKHEQFVTRLCTEGLKNHIRSRVDLRKVENVGVLIENPFVNPKMFKTSLSAIRCFEATLIALESLRLDPDTIQSKEWQSSLLGKVSGRALKVASLNLGKQLFPTIDFSNFDDADGILIAEYARRCDRE